MSTTVPATGTDPAGRARWLALAVLCAGTLMIILDGTIVTVALPAVQQDLGFSQAGLTWVVNAYVIAFGGLLLLAGRLGDMVGRRRMFVAGLVVFTAASLLCGVAPTAEVLVTARFVQGVGGAMASAVSLGMIVTLFPSGPDRAKAIGAFSFVGAGGASIGLLLGGVLTRALDWHWIFYVNLPLGVAAVALTLRVVAADRGTGLAGGADILGAALVTAGLMLAVYTIVETGHRGWGSAHTIGLGALSVAFLVAFVARQATAADPLLPLRMLGSRTVAGANLIQMLMVAALFGFQVLVALYLQRVLSYDAAQTGLAMLPTAVAIGATSLGVAARLIARVGERAVLLGGLALLFGGLALLARVPSDGRYVVDLLPVMVSLGGFGLAITALTTLGMSGATASDSGLASGLFNTTQQVGGAAGLAVLATLAAGRTDRMLAAGHAPTAALTGGYQLAFAVGAGLIVAAIVATVVILRTPAAPPREATGARTRTREPERV